ncbi:hypothetical protein BGP77_01995 [Saccharospirillum sp. MSK14-1]|uniref:hypothetical protein n=1 Tax=Saccharospirillum sp. MSK14-1 TaxID=1897632 RepID=UPI000D35E924|nr:hypothetical protein [Saccharospirillum sp. MSK14-1]PTY36113.1 hypothetical protein BGP77_01995 [Saccharospirillum sp. MSK14-1]
MLARAAFSLMLLVLLAGCASQATYEVPESETFVDWVEAKSVYEQSLAQVMGSVPVPDAEEQEDASLIQAIDQNLYPHLFWGYIQADGQIIAATDGHTDGLWILFLAEDHPSLSQPGPTLQTGQQANLMAVTVRPDRVSPAFAGVFMTHELMHGFNELFAEGALPEASEFNAYSVEKAAYNYRYNGRLDKVLDELLDDNNIESYDDLVAFTRAEDDRLDQFLLKVDSDLNHGPAYSPQEQEMRMGFYLMATSIRVGERSGSSFFDSTARLNRLLERFGRY